MENRIGKFYISHDMIKLNIEETSEVFSILKFIPLRAESLFINDNIEMIGYSHMFRIVELAECAPEYKVHITKKEDGTINIEVEEVK